MNWWNGSPEPVTDLDNCFLLFVSWLDSQSLMLTSQIYPWLNEKGSAIQKRNMGSAFLGLSFGILNYAAYFNILMSSYGDGF